MNTQLVKGRRSSQAQAKANKKQESAVLLSSTCSEEKLDQVNIKLMKGTDGMKGN